MLIGYEFFNGSCFQTKLCFPEFKKVEISNGIYDQIYIDEDITIPYDVEKPTGWNYRTVLNAKLQGDIEGGSISAGNLQIERIRIQKRETDELQWSDVAELEYKSGEQTLYEAIDKYIINDFIYQYSIIPLTATVLGNRVTSSEITADFEGIFISDKDNNYRLIYNADFGEISHNTPNSISEPLGGQFPIVTYSNLDYRSGDISALFLSTSTVNGDGSKVDIRMEKLGRQQLLKFMKNRKPKVLRSQNGESMLISMVGNPTEGHSNDINGIATLSFSYVEIGKLDSETLKENGMLVGLEEVF